MTGASCPEPACEPGQLRCSGTRLEVCNAGRNGWDFVDECVTPGVCELTRNDPVALTCLEPACDAGDVICSPAGARLACNEQRTEYSVVVAQCRFAEDCTPAGCQAEPCAVGELSCNGATLQQCQAPPGGGRPSRVTVGECGTRQLCERTLASPRTEPPACVPPVCAPGEFSCAGRQMQVCNAGRTNFINHQLCATDGLCAAGVAVGQCPAPCSGAACNGSMLRTCDEQLTALVDTEDCGSPAQCDAVAGRCSDPCVPGALRCNGATLERCTSRLSGWQRLATCDSNGLCQASVQREQTTCEAARCSPGESRCNGQRLEVCNADRTGFAVEQVCAAGQVCDAVNRQCDVCVPGTLSCNGDVAAGCSPDGQSQTSERCGPGLCRASGPVLGCLECDPPGSSRCDGERVLTCSEDHTETVTRVCGSPQLCEQTGTSAACAESGCTLPFECTSQGEVLTCNAGRTGYVSQAPRVICATPALCDVTAPTGCREPACERGERRCNGAIVEVCNDARSGFRAESTCSDGLGCVEDGAGAACACTPGSYQCLAGQGLARCNAAGRALVPVGADADCDGAVRVSCRATTLVRTPCADLAHCQASSGDACAECVDASECDDGQFCSGEEVCDGGVCRAPGDPCAAGLFCSDDADACVECRGDADCPAGEACVDGACAAQPG